MNANTLELFEKEEWSDSEIVKEDNDPRNWKQIDPQKTAVCDTDRKLASFILEYEKKNE